MQVTEANFKFKLKSNLLKGYYIAKRNAIEAKEPHSEIGRYKGH